MKYEQAIKTLKGIKATILEKATAEFNNSVRISYNGVLTKQNPEQIKNYSVNFDSNKTVITFRRTYAENKFISFVELSQEDFNKILNTVRSDDLIQEFNIWFKSVLQLHKEKLI